MFSVSKPCKALEKVTVSLGVPLPFYASESLFNGSDKSKISLTLVAHVDNPSSYATDFFFLFNIRWLCHLTINPKFSKTQTGEKNFGS